MPTLRSHTHLQEAQANAQTKAFKRICLPNLTRTVQTGHDGSLTERRAATNTNLAKVAVQCSAEPDASGWLIIRRGALLINICTKNHDRQVAKINKLLAITIT